MKYELMKMQVTALLLTRIWVGRYWVDILFQYHTEDEIVLCCCQGTIYKVLIEDAEKNNSFSLISGMRSI
jgi:hypothetical protein